MCTSQGIDLAIQILIPTYIAQNTICGQIEAAGPRISVQHSKGWRVVTLGRRPDGQPLKPA